MAGQFLCFMDDNATALLVCIAVVYIVCRVAYVIAYDSNVSAFSFIYSFYF